MPTLISDVFELRHLSARLGALGVDTLEQFRSMSLAASLELSAYVGNELDTIFSSLSTAMDMIPAEALEKISNASYPLGVDIDSIPRIDVAPEFTVIPAGGNCANLVRQMPPIRDQGTRGTCVAHAALAAYEQYLTANGAYQDLSEQFLYWNCKRSDGIPNQSGTWLAVALPLLQRDGVCVEPTWPYQPAPIAGNEGQGPPPGGSQMQALAFRVKSFRAIAPTSVADYRAELISGRAVAFSIPVYNSWYQSANVAYTGDITNPIPGETRVGGHAMCIVGCIDMPDRPEIGGGRFILRNSWGSNWGMASPHGIGYGTIPYAYIARFGSEAYSIG